MPGVSILIDRDSTLIVGRWTQFAETLGKVKKTRARPSAAPLRGAQRPGGCFVYFFLAFLQFWAVILSWMMMMAGD